jgi:hypothetical protein
MKRMDRTKPRRGVELNSEGRRPEGQLRTRWFY